MKVSLNWIRFMNQKYGCAGDPAASGIDQLVEKIGSQLGAVDEVINLGEKYKRATIAKVLSCEKHPDADKLSVCIIDAGKDKPVQVVCGAPNVAASQKVVWLPPGATVPNTFDKDPFVLDAREIRGVVSHGMIASAKELALGEDHSGILVLDDGKPGQSFAEVYELNDTIIDIENKMFTHRPDLFGMLGIARELAGIQQHAFKSPDWYKEDADLQNDGRKNVLKFAVKNELPEIVSRFTAIAIKDVEVKDSPVWLKVRLASAGVRPINNIVDLTNFFMLETAQPLHAYDYDKVKTGVLGVRASREGEKLTVIGSKEINLKAGATVITDGEKPIGLGGVIGGASTEVDSGTKNIILEVADFDMNMTRRTAMEYGLFTDAATRFTKNQSPRQQRAVLVKAVEDIRRVAGGRVASLVIDDKHFKSDNRPIKTSSSFINSRLGSDLSAAAMQKILQNVEFTVKLSGDELTVTAPFWRTDIEIPEDIVEEVGRLHGYDQLPIVLPKRDLTPAVKDPVLDLKAGVREILKRAGANEVLTYSFVHESLLKKVGQDPQDAYHIRNAISPDLQYYRLSLTPSLLDKVHPNIRAGFGEFAIFELGKGHNQKIKNKDGLPEEFEMLSLVMASKTKDRKVSGAPYFESRRILDFLADELGIKLEYRPIKDEEPYPVAKPFEHSRSAQVWTKDYNLPLGMVGEYKQSVIRNLKLPVFTSGFEIGITPLLQSVSDNNTYHFLNRFPELEQDFNLRAGTDINYQQLDDFMAGNLETLCKKQGYEYRLEPLDIFQKESDQNHKQTTWRIILWHPERTLITAETNKLLEELANRAKEELKAERI